MFKFFIDVFCKDTIIGLSSFENIKKNKLYKNKYNKTSFKKNFHSKKNFIDPIACHL